jgi:hypothetical protein
MLRKSEQGFNVMIAVFAAPTHVQRKVDLGIGGLGIR